MPRQTGQTFVLGGAPNTLAQPHHIFDFVLSWTWVSSPIAASYSIIEGTVHRLPPINTAFESVTMSRFGVPMREFVRAILFPRERAAVRLRRKRFSRLEPLNQNVPNVSQPT